MLLAWDEWFTSTNVDEFEKIPHEDYSNTLLQNIINVEHIIDDENKAFKIAPIKGFLIFWIILL
jgi:hypothetical protein